ncbi:MAG: M16 family metallopeptidase [Hyphomicrobiales bacterium]
MSAKITELANGLRVVSYEMPQLQTVSMGVWVRAGARSERAEQNGVAHFLEHMAFKGTERRSAIEIAEEIESVGGDINASTSSEITAYYVRVLKDDIPLAMDILSDILLNPVFVPEELERERNVILQEISAAKDTPDDLVFDLAQEVAYPGQSIGRPILGPAEKVSRYTASDIHAFRSAHYCSSSIVVSAAGGLRHEQLVELAEKAFGGMQKSKGSVWAPATYEGGFKFAERPLEQTHIVLGFSGPGYLSEDIYTLQVLGGVLGGGMSSKLFREVREKRGLCYSIFAYPAAFEDASLVSVYAATAPNQVSELTKVITGELANAMRDITEEEVARARAQLKAGLMMSLESSSARADQIARQLLSFGKVPKPETIIEKVDKVDAEAVRALSQRIFSGVKPSFGAVGALSGLASYEEIAAQFA